MDRRPVSGRRPALYFRARHYGAQAGRGKDPLSKRTIGETRRRANRRQSSDGNLHLFGRPRFARPLEGDARLFPSVAGGLRPEVGRPGPGICQSHRQLRKAYGQSHPGFAELQPFQS